MYLYLKYKTRYEIVSGVTLRDGHQPVVANTLPCHPKTKELVPIEPALWYKTLLIDSIVIDCNSREVQWSRGKLSQRTSSTIGSEDNNRRALVISSEDVYSSISPDSMGFPSLVEFGEPVIDDGGVYDFDPSSDTFFLEVTDLVERYKAKKTSVEEFHLTLLRLLHCYVLPQIVLSRKDIPMLHRVKRFIDRQLRLAEDAIDQKSQSIELLQTTLKKLRHSFIDEFQSEAMVRMYNNEFLRKMSYKLQHDVDEATTELERCQNEVDQIKLLVDIDPVPPVLAEKREERDSALTHFTRVATVRENVLNAVVRPPKTKKFRRSRGLKPTLLEVQTKYLKVHSLLEEMKATMHELYSRKLKVISVSEALRSALSDLETDMETLGMQFSVDGSQRATDVLDSKRRPEEWMTLEERVGNALTTHDTDVYTSHVRFRHLINDRISAALDEMGLLSIDTATNPIFLQMESSFESALDLAGQGAQRKRKSRSSSRLIQSLCVFGEDNLMPLKAKCESLKKEIHAHFYEVIKNLQENHKLNTNEGKLWMCYEAHIYPLILPYLTRLYNAAYEPITNLLIKTLPALKPNDLGIKEDWLLELTEFEQEHESISQFRSPCSCAQNAEDTQVKRPLSDSSDDDVSEEGTEGTNHRLSYELSHRSLHTLYQRANLDGQKIQEELDTCGIPTNFGYSFDNTEDGLRDSDLVESVSTNFKTFDAGEVFDRQFGVTAISRWSDLDSVGSMSSQKSSVNGLCSCDTSVNMPEQPPRYSFSVAFEPAIAYIRSIPDKVTILSKLKQLTKAFRFIGRKVSDLKSVSGHHRNGKHGRPDVVYQPCCDDMLNVCILLLTYLKQDEIKSFYSSLNLMIDLMAPCLQNGVHDCTLVNFQGAFQYVIDHEVSRTRSPQMMLADLQSEV